MIVRNFMDILKNMETLEKYRKLGEENQNEEEFIFYRETMAAGNNFVVVEVGGRYFFAPSKFVGYLNNSMPTHRGLRAVDRDGRKTNVAIDKIMWTSKNENESVDRAFIKFCEENGFRPFENRTREYWIVHVSPDIRPLTGIPVDRSQVPP